MSKFLTPPVWYDGYGTLNDMLTGKSVEAEGGNVVIGSSAEAGAHVFTSVIIFGSATGTESATTSNAIIAGVGASAFGTGVIAIGAGSSATAEGAIASGLSAQAKNTGAIAIGRGAAAEAVGAIAIGDGASASSQNTIQLGNNVKYNLKVGNGNGVTSGYIEKGISSPDNDPKYGFVDVSYGQDGNYVKEDVSGGIYIVRVKNNTVGHQTLCTFLFEIDGRKTEYSSLFEYDGGTEFKYAVIKATPDGTGTVTLSVVNSVEYGTAPIQEHTNFTISVRRISQSYPVG